jgi:hypothetical protein
MSAARSTMDRELALTAAPRGERAQLDGNRCGHRGRQRRLGDRDRAELAIELGVVEVETPHGPHLTESDLCCEH